MKKLLVLAFVASLMISCDNGKTEIARLNAQLDSICEVNSEQQDKMNNLSELMDVVNESLDSIAEQEELLLGSTKGAEGKLSKKELKKRFKDFADLLQRQRERISSLGLSLDSSNKEISKLKKVIDYFNQQLSDKEASILSMSAELDKKNADIKVLTEKVQHLDETNTELRNTIEEQSTTIKNNDVSMHTCYYRIGSKKELKAAGLLTKAGLFSKSQLNVAGIDYQKCSKIDMRNVEEILIPCKKPKILTHVPAGSYKIEVSGDNSVLKILNADTFWSVSNVLIIQTN